MSLLNSILDLIFPPICLSCNKWGSTICPSCLSQFQNRTFSICPTCLKNSPHGLRHDICTDPTKPIDGLISYWRYTENLKRIIKQIKYQGYYAATPQLIQQFLSQDAIELNPYFQQFLETKPILIPVPIHKRRQRERGFNQSHKFAKQLTNHWKIPLSTKIIYRTQYTKPQVELEKKDRTTNLTGKFAPTKQISNLLPQKPLTAYNVLLVDDVWTTGSTLQNCALEIKKLGAKSIWALTIAR